MSNLAPPTLLSAMPLRLTAAAAVLLALLGPAPPAVAQEPAPSEADHYFSNGRQVEVTVSLDRVGVLLRDGVGPERINAVAESSGLRLLRAVDEKILILAAPQPMERSALVQLAREVQSGNRDFIAQAGLLVTPAQAVEPMILTPEIVIQLSPTGDGAEVARMNEDLGFEVVMENPFVKGQLLLRALEGVEEDALALANRYHESGLVEYAHPNFVKVVIPRETIPTDTLFGNQWHHRNTGQAGGTVDADIDTSWAWDLTLGAVATTIAVIDGGFDMTHPDLTPNLSANPGEIAGNGLDDDGNTYVDDVNGWDFTGCDAAPGAGCGDNNPTGPDTQFGRHGTAVAGTAVARGNNALGVTGSCPNCGWIPIRLPNTDFAQGLAFGYAQQLGAQVITNSWGFSIGTPCATNLCTAINAAATNGRGGLGSVVLFAMNNPNVNDCTGANPDISSLANVIAVSRSTNQDQFDFSGFGNCMDVLAPTAGLGTVGAGRGTLWGTTTDMQGAAGYNNNATSASCPTAEAAPPPANARDYTACFNGTSFATPMVAGAAGLILSSNAALTRLQVQQLLQDTTDHVEDSTGAYATATGFSSPATGQATHGFGRVNAFEAVRIAAPVATGGKAAVDVFLRDNRLDWGNTERPSNTLFEPVRGFIGHWRSEDIKVDAPPYQPAPTAATFEAFVDETPSAAAGDTNRVYVRVHNRGPVTAASATVKLFWAQFGTGLPPLPADFWTAFPGDSTDPSNRWTPMSCSTGGTTCTIANLAYSGSSVASTPADAAQVVRFDFPAPPVDPALPNHFCLLGMVDSPQDGISADSRASFVVDAITPADNNVTHRNYHDLSTGGRSRFEEPFFVRNPSREAVRAVLRLRATEGFKAELDRFGIDQEFTLEPGAEELVTVSVVAPAEGVTGEVEIQQETWVGKSKVVGGVTLGFRPPAVPMASGYASLNGVSLVGDPGTGSAVGYLGDGEGYGLEAGDTFSFAPIQLPHGARVLGLRCVVRDASDRGYIQITLGRGPINTTDPIVPTQVIASASTTPGGHDAAFREVSGTADASRSEVDNQYYGYFFRVDFLDHSGSEGGEVPLRLRGCSVEYAE